ncbi:hypothetical protein PAYE108092_12495 [Paracoccus yeei]
MRQVGRQQADAQAIGDHGAQHLDRAGLGGDARRHPGDLEQRQEIAPAVGQVDQHHRIGGQIRHRDGPGAGQRVPGRHQGMGRHGLQLRQRQIRRKPRVIDQGQVDAAPAQALFQIRQVALGQRDPRAGMPVGEAAHQARRMARPQRGIDPQRQRALWPRGGRQGRAGLREKPFKRRHLLPPERGRLHPLSRQSQEHRLAEMRLDQRHRMRDRGLRDIHRARGGGGRSGFRDRQQVGNLAKPEGYRFH